MRLFKNFFSDKGRVGVAILCLLMLSVMAVSAITRETLAADTFSNGDVTTQSESYSCWRCKYDDDILKWSTNNAADDKCTDLNNWEPNITDRESCKTYT